MSEGPKNGVWVGLKRCGCCVGVVCDDGDPSKRKMLNQAKRQMLADGLSVLNASWQDWRDKYMPAFMECSHEPVSVPPPDPIPPQEPR